VISPSIELGVSTRTVRTLLASIEMRAAVLSMNFSRLVYRSSSGASASVTRSIRCGISTTQSIAGTTIAPIAKIEIARNTSTHSPDASPDGTPLRSNHSSIGTSAMAITSAAVTGKKNSAPARSANGSASSSPIPPISVSEASSRTRLTSSCSASCSCESLLCSARASIDRL